jgi:hypothetical protein|tara:strand:+ start:1150 stop:1782 length:633 start_codon:yes stop_codon:yes gene_type:complete
MSSCSQYAAAFGYEVYLVPVSACGVDLSAVNGGIGTTAGSFIDITSPLVYTTPINAGTAGQIMAGDPGASPVDIVYDNNVITTETTVKLTGLSNASLETDTGSETVQTYDSENRGFDQNVALTKSWSLSIEGMSQFTDAAYKVVRLLEQGAVDGSLKAKVGRVGPTGTTEAVYGYGTLTNFSESVEAGSIVSYSIEITGFGPYKLDLDNN